MKKTLCLFCALALFLSLLCACGKKDAEPTEPAEPTTWGLVLDNLPDIGKYDPKTSPRMFDEYVDNLIPRSDYGELVPYLGATLDYRFRIEDKSETTLDDGTFFGTKGVFGLCKKDGTIVTDAVYSSIEYCDGYYLLKKAVVDSTYDPSDFRGNFYVIPKDGSSIFAFEKNIWVRNYGSGVFCAEYDWENNNQKYFSATGKLILDNSDGMQFLSPFVNGIARFYDGETTCFVDTSMKKLLTVADAEKLSDDGYFSVLTESGKHKIYKGITPVSDEEFEYVGMDEGLFIVRNGNLVSVLDRSLKKLSEFSLPGSFEFFSLCSKDILYCDECYITSDGKRLPYPRLDYCSDCGLYVSYDYDSTIATVMSAKFKKLYTAPEGLYPSSENSHGKYIVFSRPLDPDNGEFYEYFLMDTTDGKIIENIGIIDGFDGYSEAAADGRHRELFSAKDGSTLLTYSTFVSMQKTSVGTLYFYDLDGYAITADENFNIICRVPLGMEY